MEIPKGKLPDEIFILKSNQPTSLDSKGQPVKEGAKRSRVNLVIHPKEKSEMEVTISIAAKRSLPEEANKIKNWIRHLRYVTVESGEGSEKKTIDLNINSLALRLHLKKKEIIKAAIEKRVDQLIINTLREQDREEAKKIETMLRNRQKNQETESTKRTQTEKKIPAEEKIPALWELFFNANPEAFKGRSDLPSEEVIKAAQQKEKAKRDEAATSTVEEKASPGPESVGSHPKSSPRISSHIISGKERYLKGLFRKKDLPLLKKEPLPHKSIKGAEFFGESQVYRGEIPGLGLLIYPNGEVFKGTFNIGLPVKGELRYPDGTIFKGNLVIGIPNHGKLIHPDQMICDGNFINGKLHGQVKVTHPNTEGYEFWHYDKGEPTGQKMKYKGPKQPISCEHWPLGKSGTFYTGPVNAQGKPEGEGTVTRRDGTTYPAIFVAGEEIKKTNNIPT